MEQLSKRELEVLELVLQGKTNQQIGDQLYIAEGTVKSHIRTIAAKLECQTKLEIVVKVISAQKDAEIEKLRRQMEGLMMGRVA